MPARRMGWDMDRRVVRGVVMGPGGWDILRMGVVRGEGEGTAVVELIGKG